MKILLVDDDPAILEIFEMALALNYDDCIISSAINGVDALKMCEEDNFDLIFSDGMMPKMDGLELAKRLAELKYQASIVLVTGYHKVMDESDAEALGIHKILYKPVKFEEIYECVDLVKNNLNG